MTYTYIHLSLTVATKLLIDLKHCYYDGLHLISIHPCIVGLRPTAQGPVRYESPATVTLVKGEIVKVDPNAEAGGRELGETKSELY